MARAKATKTETKQPKAQVQAATDTGDKISRYQKFDTQTIHRSQLKGAPYNPRQMSDENRERLKQSLKEHGLVMPPVWNKRTGTLVGGHQRLTVLDALEGTDDYELTVAVVDVDEREEKILNVQLNNEFSMGSWDFDMLSELSFESDISLEEMGFSEEVAFLFNGDDRFAETFETEDYKGDTTKLEAMREARKKGSEDLKRQNSVLYYFTVVCKDSEDRADLMGKLGYPPAEECVHSDAIRRALS